MGYGAYHTAVFLSASLLSLAIGVQPFAQCRATLSVGMSYVSLAAHQLYGAPTLYGVGGSQGGVVLLACVPVMSGQ